MGLFLVALVTVALVLLIRYSSGMHFVPQETQFILVDELAIGSPIAATIDAWDADASEHPWASSVPVFPAHTRVTVRGWANSPSGDAAVGQIDGVSYVHGEYGDARPDVAAALHSATAGHSGFRIYIDTAHLTSGLHTLRIGVATVFPRSVHLSAPVPFRVAQ